MKIFLELLVHHWIDGLLAEGALIFLLEPRLNALCVENVSDVAREWRDHELLFVFWVLLELIQTNRALNTIPENILVISLLDETISQHRQAFLLFNPLPGHLAVHVDEDGNE